MGEKGGYKRDSTKEGRWQTNNGEKYKDLDTIWSIGK